MYFIYYINSIICALQGQFNQYPNPQVPFYQGYQNFDDCEEMTSEKEFEKSIVNFDPFYDDTKNSNAFYDDCIDDNDIKNKQRNSTTKQKDNRSYSQISSREESSKDNIVNEVSSVDQHDINKLKRKDVYYVDEKGSMYPSLGPFENDKRSPFYHPIVNKIRKEDHVVDDKDARIDPKFMTKLANGGWYERKTIKPITEKGADVYVERIGFWPRGKKSKRKHSHKYYSHANPRTEPRRYPQKPKEKSLSESIAQMGYPFTDVPHTVPYNSSRKPNDEASYESDHQNSRRHNSLARGYLPGEPKYLRDKHRNSSRNAKDETSSDSFSQSGYPHAGGLNDRARGYLQGEVKHLKDEQLKAMGAFDEKTDDLKKKKDAAMRKARNVIRVNNIAKMQDRINKKKNQHMGEKARQYADIKANGAANLAMLSMVPGPAAAKAKARQLKNKMQKGFGKFGRKKRKI